MINQQPEWVVKINQFGSENFILILPVVIAIVYLFFKISKGKDIKSNIKFSNANFNNTKRCIKCLNVIFIEDKFCGSCGEKINTK